MLTAKSSTVYSPSTLSTKTSDNNQVRLLTGNLSQLISNSKTKNDSQENDKNDNTLQVALTNSVKTLSNYQPSISDQIKVGFYSSDRFTQTDETEILVLKNATENLDYLCKEINVVKYDLKFAKNSSQNQFEEELFNKSIEIYGIINNKVSELKFQQEQSLDRMRRAYKSKLANAAAYFKKLAEVQREEIEIFKKKNAKKDTRSSEEQLQRIKELQRTIVEQELKMKELQLKANENMDKMNAENERLIETLKEERDKAAEAANKTKSKLKRLEEALMIKEEESDKMMSEMTNLQMQLEKEKINNEQLEKEFNEFKVKSEQEKSKMKKEFDKQKISIETKLNEKIKESRDQIMNAAKNELKQQQLLQKQQEQALLEQQQRQEQQYQQMLKQQQEALEREKIEKEKELENIKTQKKLEDERKDRDKENEKLSLTEALQREKEKEQAMNSLKSSKDAELISKLKSNELYLKSEINRLKRELHRNNETWEKKFDILKHSLHAIKDEMYLRQNLQKQSAQLAYASVAYTMNQAPTLQQQFPQIIDSNKANSNQIENNKIAPSPNKPVLPSIGSAKNLERQMSFTISVPSRLSGIDNDEGQIVDDEEMNQLKEEYFNDIDFIPAKQA